jgi:endonuclease YncB( thermonuclease family)
LTWSHYRLLLRLPDSEARKACELAAVENGWSVRELEAQIRSGVFEVGALVEQSVRTLAPDLNLPALRGQFYTYRLVDDPDGENTRVDLGFGIHSSWSIVGGNGLKAGQLVKVIREGKGGFRCEVAQGRPSAFYTYQARVLSVIDGDTLWLDIDCGFRVWTRQKVRLRGIDAPELGTAEGQRAKDFVVRALSEGSFVAVTTTKPDKYDRYLADVFYGKGTEDRVLQDGWFLSRTLLEAGLATRFRG